MAFNTNWRNVFTISDDFDLWPLYVEDFGTAYDMGLCEILIHCDVVELVKLSKGRECDR